MLLYLENHKTKRFYQLEEVIDIFGVKNLRYSYGKISSEGTTKNKIVQDRLEFNKVLRRLLNTGYLIQGTA
jgi:predicted DNA-binding WGR domain protein